MANLAGVVQQLKKERDEAARVVERLEAALAVLDGAGNRSGGRRRLSAAARARIAAAQRARWAKARSDAGQKQSTSIPKKKTMSATARRKIAAAQRARWAKFRARKKAA